MSENQMEIQVETKVDEQEIEIDLVEVVGVLLKNLKWIVLSALACALLVGAYAVIDAKLGDAQTAELQKHVATATVYYLDTYLDLIQGTSHSMETSLSADMQQFAVNRAVVQPVLDQYAPTLSYKSFLASYTVSQPLNTHMLCFAVTDQDPDLAIALSNALAESFVAYVAQTMDVDEPVIFQLATEELITEVEVVEEGASTAVMMLVGALLGGGVAAAVVLFKPYVLSFVCAVRTKKEEMEAAEYSKNGKDS